MTDSSIDEESYMSRSAKRFMSRSAKLQLIENVQWHITKIKENLGKVNRRTGDSASGGQRPITDEVMRWHFDAAERDLKRVATAARKRSWIDLGAIIALIALIVSISVFIGTWASTNSDNGGLHERVNGLQDQVTALQGQLTDVRGSYGRLTALVDGSPNLTGAPPIPPSLPAQPEPAGVRLRRPGRHPPPGYLR